MNPMILFPNAKINIGLYITSRRDDGYHNLETLFFPVGWQDIMEIVPAKGTQTTLTVSGNAVECPPEKNLVMKAYAALNDVIPLPPVDIYLHKIIPDGAGLGGGSADAAFTLKGLNELFSLEMTDGQLAEIAAKIGADCPFFIYNRPMLAKGIGNEFTPVDIDLSGKTIAIVKPHESVSTREAYSGVTPMIPECDLTTAISADIKEWRGKISNDFEKSIFPLHPAIQSVKEQLYALGADYASMSGSGAAVYGIFQSDNYDRLSEQLAKTFPGCATFSGKILLS